MLSRREFLAATAAATMTASAIDVRIASSSETAFSSKTLPSDWPLSPETGLLERIAGCGVVDQLTCASRLGFTAFADPQWCLRTAAERRALSKAARQHGVRLGPIVGPATSPDSRQSIPWRREIQDVILMAAEHGLPGVRISAGPEILFHHGGLHSMWDDWRWAADLAAAHNQVVLVDPWDDGRCGTRLFDVIAIFVWNVKLPQLKLVVDSQQFADISPYFLEQIFRRDESLREVYRRSRPGSSDEDVSFLWERYLPRHRSDIGHVELHTLDEGKILSAISGLIQSGYRGMIGLRGSLTEPVDQFLASCRRASTISARMLT